jgi:hypothetical protein
MQYSQVIVVKLGVHLLAFGVKQILLHFRFLLMEARLVWAYCIA